MSPSPPLRPSPPRSPWWSPSWWKRRLRLWTLRQGVRHLPPAPLDEILVLRLLALALLVIVLAETVLLLLSPCVPLLLSTG